MSPFFRLPRYLHRHSHRRETSPPKRTLFEGSETQLCHTEAPKQLELPALEIVLSSVTNPGTPPEHLVDAVRCLKPFLPIGCELLGQDDLRIVGSSPIDADGFADVWVGERNDGTVVAIKSHRHHATLSCRSIYLVSHQRSLSGHPVSFTEKHHQRLYQEALTCSRLNYNDKSFVPFIGIYSTRDHPFTLVLKFMEHRTLRAYLRVNKDVRRLDLVCASTFTPVAPYSLTPSTPVIGNRSWSEVYAWPCYRPWKSQDCMFAPLSNGDFNHALTFS